MLAAPTIIGIIFIILILCSPCIFKFALKIDSFFGLCQGICCSFLTALIISAAVIIGFIVYGVSVADSIDANNPSAEDIAEKAGIGFLLFAFFVIAVAYLAIFFLILCYTKRVSDPQYSYNSIFMFISGYTILSFTVIYVVIVIICLAADSVAKENNIQDNTVDSASSGLFVLFEFIIFGEIINRAGISILFMLHHRKVNSMMLWIGCGIYFGPLIFFLIGLLARVPALLEYPLFLFDIASISLGIFFYIKYAYQTASTGNTLVGESPYEMQA